MPGSGGEKLSWRVVILQGKGEIGKSFAHSCHIYTLCLHISLCENALRKRSPDVSLLTLKASAVPSDTSF